VIPTKTLLSNGAYVEYHAGFLGAAEASRAQAALVEQLAWEQRAIVLFGKPVVQPRLVAWVGAVPYRYSGQTLERREGPPLVGALTARVNERAGVAFNHVLVNRYRDGRDSMGMHSDDEPELGPDPVVATLSLGTERKLVLVPRRGKEQRREIRLEHGSLLVMYGPCQAHYRHGIPKTSTLVGERISLTFRRVVSVPP
jgi:alkylated DNA repair dioxygenase AlkB